MILNTQYDLIPNGKLNQFILLKNQGNCKPSRGLFGKFPVFGPKKAPHPGFWDRAQQVQFFFFRRGRVRTVTPDVAAQSSSIQRPMFSVSPV